MMTLTIFIIKSMTRMSKSISAIVNFLLVEFEVKKRDTKHSIIEKKVSILGR